MQLRLMHSDAERVTEVLDILLPLLRSCTALQVGDPEDLRMRDPGGRRVAIDVAPARQGTTIRVERAEEPGPGPGRSSPRRARALPPGSSS